MAKNLNLFFDTDGSPRARGPSSEKLLMAFLEADVQGSDHICHDIMDDITAIEDKSAESREFIGNAHSVIITAEGVTIECVIDDTDVNSTIDDTNVNDVAKSANANPDDAQHSHDASDGGHVKKSPVEIQKSMPEPTQYQTGLKHFREVLEDWESSEIFLYVR